MSKIIPTEITIDVTSYSGHIYIKSRIYDPILQEVTDTHLTKHGIYQLISRDIISYSKNTHDSHGAIHCQIYYRKTPFTTNPKIYNMFIDGIYYQITAHFNLP